MTEELYDISQASEKIGISFMTLRRWLEANKVNYSFRYKNHILFSDSDIEKIIESKISNKIPKRKETKTSAKTSSFSSQNSSHLQPHLKTQEPDFSLEETL